VEDGGGGFQKVEVTTSWRIIEGGGYQKVEE